MIGRHDKTWRKLKWNRRRFNARQRGFSDCTLRMRLEFRPYTISCSLWSVRNDSINPTCGLDIHGLTGLLVLVFHTPAVLELIIAFSWLEAGKDCIPKGWRCWVGYCSYNTVIFYVSIVEYETIKSHCLDVGTVTKLRVVYIYEHTYPRIYRYVENTCGPSDIMKGEAKQYRCRSKAVPLQSMIFLVIIRFHWRIYLGCSDVTVRSGEETASGYISRCISCYTRVFCPVIANFTELCCNFTISEQRVKWARFCKVL